MKNKILSISLIIMLIYNISKVISSNINNPDQQEDNDDQVGIAYVDTEEQFDSALANETEREIILRRDINLTTIKEITRNVSIKIGENFIKSTLENYKGFIIKGKSANLTLDGLKFNKSSIFASIEIKDNGTLNIYGNVYFQHGSIYAHPGIIKMHGITENMNQTGVSFKGDGNGYGLKATDNSEITFLGKEAFTYYEYGMIIENSTLFMNGTIIELDKQGIMLRDISKTGLYLKDCNNARLFGTVGIFSNGKGVELINSTMEAQGDFMSDGVAIRGVINNDSVGIYSKGTKNKFTLKNHVRVSGMESSIILNDFNFVELVGYTGKASENKSLLIGNEKDTNGIYLNGKNITVNLYGMVTINTTKNSFVFKDTSSLVTFNNKIIKMNYDNEAESIFDFATVSKLFINQKNSEDFCPIQSMSFPNGVMSIFKDDFCKDKKDKIINNITGETNTKIDAYIDDYSSNIKLIILNKGNIKCSIPSFITTEESYDFDFKYSLNSITPSNFVIQNEGTKVNLNYKNKPYLLKEIQLIDKNSSVESLIIPYQNLDLSDEKNNNYKFTINYNEELLGEYKIKTLFTYSKFNFIDEANILTLHSSLHILSISLDNDTYSYEKINKIGFNKGRKLKIITITFDKNVEKDRLILKDDHSYNFTYYRDSANRSNFIIEFGKKLSLFDEDINFSIEDVYVINSNATSNKYYFSINNLFIKKVSPQYPKLSKEGTEIFLYFSASLSGLKNIELFNKKTKKNILSIPSSNITKAENELNVYKFILVKNNKFKNNTVVSMKINFENSLFDLVDNTNHIYIYPNNKTEIMYKLLCIIISCLTFCFIITIIILGVKFKCNCSNNDRDFSLSQSEITNKSQNKLFVDSSTDN